MLHLIYNIFLLFVPTCACSPVGIIRFCLVGLFVSLPFLLWILFVPLFVPAFCGSFSACGCCTHLPAFFLPYFVHTAFLWFIPSLWSAISPPSLFLLYRAVIEHSSADWCTRLRSFYVPTFLRTLRVTILTEHYYHTFTLFCSFFTPHARGTCTLPRSPFFCRSATGFTPHTHPMPRLSRTLIRCDSGHLYPLRSPRTVGTGHTWTTPQVTYPTPHCGHTVYALYFTDFATLPCGLRYIHGWIPVA